MLETAFSLIYLSVFFVGYFMVLGFPIKCIAVMERLLPVAVMPLLMCGMGTTRRGFIR